MATPLHGDYSSYPADMRQAICYVFGETLDVRSHLAVFRRLFVESETRTRILASSLGGVLGLFQESLANGINLRIARLTDPRLDSLTVTKVHASIPRTADVAFKTGADAAKAAIDAAVVGIRRNRHKRIAHLDIGVGTGLTPLPHATVTEWEAAIVAIENYLNALGSYYEGRTMFFEFVNTDAAKVTSASEFTVAKAQMLDRLADAGVIEKPRLVDLRLPE